MPLCAVTILNRWPWMGVSSAAQPPAAVENRTSDDRQIIQIGVRDQEGREVLVRALMGTQLARVMTAYCKKFAVPAESGVMRRATDSRIGATHVSSSG